MKGKYDLPDGWTCIGCGDEYLEDTEGKLVANYDEGTLCKKCDEEDKPQAPSATKKTQLKSIIKTERNKNAKI
tara:strand:- start:134 stop:352 length:219 start_codon:yes stop_codon:yes gene_type:complete